MIKEKIIEETTRMMLDQIEIKSGFIPRIYKSEGEIGLYIHIPFCKIPCPYCGFIRFKYNAQKIEGYVESLKREIKLYKDLLDNLKINSLYIGGGTPTINPNALCSIIEYVNENFDIKEIGVEANPDDITQKVLEMLSSVGVRKISMGVESFNDSILKAIGRRSHTSETAINAIKLIVDCGYFDTFSIDLMFSLPSQRVENLISDLEIATSLGIPQIATYPVVLFSFNRWYKDVKRGLLKLPGKKSDRTMYDILTKFLLDRGYKPCSVWSFIKEGYTPYGSVERDEYFGFGAGALSKVDGQMYGNTNLVDEYIKALSNEHLPIVCGIDFSVEERMAEFVMMSLYSMGFKQNEFKNIFGCDINNSRIKGLLHALRFLGIINLNNGEFKVTKNGMYYVHLMTKIFLGRFIDRICNKCFSPTFNVKPLDLLKQST
ncbi:MAG: coproporphyrinogen-III oxidase family protein [Candidatus Micrarchaeota archaeon]